MTENFPDIVKNELTKTRHVQHTYFTISTHTCSSRRQRYRLTHSHPDLENPLNAGGMSHPSRLDTTHHVTNCPPAGAAVKPRSTRVTRSPLPLNHSHGLFRAPGAVSCGCPIHLPLNRCLTLSPAPYHCQTNCMVPAFSADACPLKAGRADCDYCQRCSGRWHLGEKH